MEPERPVESVEQGEVADFNARLRALTPRPRAVAALIAANLIVFAMMVSSGVSPIDPDSESLIAWGADFGPATTTGEPWRAFTCMFVHVGVVHLALNMWALFAAGLTIERIFGSASFLLLYCFSGLAGSLASVGFNEATVSAGASGAIFGTFGGLVAFLLIRRGAIHVSVAGRLWRGAAPTIVYSLFYGFTSTGIDNAAHVGGLLAGFLLGLVLSRPLAPQPVYRSLGLLTAGACAGALILAALWVAAPKEWAAYVADREALDIQVGAFETAIKELQAQWKQGDIDHHEFAGTIERAHLPAIKAAAARLERTPEWIRQGEPGFFEFLVLYVRRWEVYTAGVKDLDEAKLDEALRIERQMARIVQEQSPPADEDKDEGASGKP